MENAHPIEDGAGAPDTGAAIVSGPGRFIGTKNPRQLRALAALLPPGAKVHREQMDRITGSSNSPDVIRCLRQRGLPADVDGLTEDCWCLRCDDVQGVDRDGRACTTGIYYLTAEGRRRVHAWLAEMGKTIDDLLAGLRDEGE